MSGGRIRSVTLSALALAVLIPVVGQAATLKGPGDLERARQLREKAEALFDQPAAWGKAAAMLERSAALRSANDAEAYECLSAAGRIRAALRQNDAAIRLLTRAGDHALARGAVLDAGESYAMAAHAAVADNDVARAKELGDKVRLLSMSPMLTEKQRADLTARID